MDEIITEQAGSILRVQFNRPTKRNAMTSAMTIKRQLLGRQRGPKVGISFLVPR